MIQKLIEVPKNEQQITLRLHHQPNVNHNAILIGMFTHRHVYPSQRWIKKIDSCIFDIILTPENYFKKLQNVEIFLHLKFYKMNTHFLLKKR
jgi:hypothetical protein